MRSDKLLDARLVKLTMLVTVDYSMFWLVVVLDRCGGAFMVDLMMRCDFWLSEGERQDFILCKRVLYSRFSTKNVPRKGT